MPLDGPGVPAVPTPYRGLSFTPLDVIAEALLPEILFHTQPNAAAIETLNTVLGQHIVLNSKYGGSKVLDFALSSFWFACKTPSVQQACSPSRSRASCAQLTPFRATAPLPSRARWPSRATSRIRKTPRSAT